jgi:multimeric flavodoxin WrbA
MKIAAFVGSPRSTGSTDALVREVLRGAADAGAETGIFHLGEAGINGCRACMDCREGGVCSQNDGMTVLYDELRSADAVVLGTPVYFYYMTAQMKAFTDRLFATIGESFERRFGERDGVLVVTQGAEGPEVFTSQIESMKGAWEMAGLRMRETILACSMASREHALADSRLMERSFLAGKKLALASWE